jgi:IclR family transcriptional regulator, acetate operon repressor
MERHSVQRNHEAEGQVSDGALDKALKVLEALIDGAPASSLADIAASAGLAKPTTHRILQTFVARRYARTGGDGLYQPGSQILALAGHVLLTLDYARHARPALIELQESIPETVHFGVLQGHEVVYAEKLDGLRAFRMASTVGMRLTVHSTSVGKVILANLPPDERELILTNRPLVARTARTITDRDKLDAELALILAQGYACDDEENEEGIRCLGAAVFGNLGTVIGGVSVSVPAFQFPRERFDEYSLLVRRAAFDISSSLGCPASVLSRNERLLAPAQARLASIAAGSVGE